MATEKTEQQDREEFFLDGRKVIVIFRPEGESLEQRLLHYFEEQKPLTSS